MDIGVIAIIIFLVIVAFLTFAPDWMSESAGSLWDALWSLLQKIFTFGILILMGIFVLPAMLIMAWLYPIWHDWIKGHGKWKDNLLMLIGIIPVSILVLYAMIVMAALHPAFETRVAAIFGKKPF